MATLNQLPTELLLEVCSWLPAAAAGSLALTSRQFYLDLHTSSQFQQLKCHSEQRTELLLHFDSALPSHQLCHACGVFHPRDSRCPNSGLADHGWIRLGFGRVYWSTIQMAMRGLKYGDAYGAAAALIRNQPAIQNQWARDCRAVCVEDRLLVREKFYNTYSSPWCSPLEEPLMCAHTRGSYMCWSGMFDLFGQVRSNPGAKATSDSYRCSHCQTELRITVEPFGAAFLWTFHRYLELGNCLRPTETEWMVLCRSLGDWPHRPMLKKTPVNLRDLSESLSEKFETNYIPTSMDHWIKDAFPQLRG
ncbi:hypothetical protein BDV96DRAFT_119121 [Lophiotrema nucula]|uniref:F-box domain-containing protein n=1 Tax=Lophiotrema nucula TaxID=690887 RepID=A0A6A5Z1B3_9PLEO|nr:hypothetical protein BDV96DRAFT_119121 [Lophiotrema nucula]